MKSVYDTKENCCGCAACKQVCPTQSINMQEDGYGYIYPVIDADRCIDCTACKKVCPLREDIAISPDNKQVCYAYVNSDEEYRSRSASSGAFEALCSAFIQGNENYSIHGCELDKKLHAKHCSIDDIGEIYRLKKSKYIQSYIDNEYADVLKELNEGKKVVFSGTPCQVAALRKFIKRDFENLLTVDFVCHGVPNQRIFSEYIEEIEKKYHAKILKYVFRNKRKIMKQWSTLGVRIEFDNGKIIELEAEDDLYMTGFLNGLFNRESCYKCKFASLNRNSDITIGDFWGIDKIYPELDETKTNGTSLIIGNSTRGIHTIERLNPAMLYLATLNDAIKENGQLQNPMKSNGKRIVFLSAFERNKKFSDCVKRAFPEKYGFRKETIYQMRFYIGLSKIKHYILGKIKST